MWYNYLKILQFFPHYPFCHSNCILVLCSFVWLKLYVEQGLHGHTKIDTWCAGCSCFMQGLNNFLICTMIGFSCHANWRVWCLTQLQMPGAAESHGPWALVARVAIEGQHIKNNMVTWVVTMLSYQRKEHDASVSEIPWLENKTSLLECIIQKYLQLRKSEHHTGHNHSSSAASFERKNSPPWEKPLHEMLQKWQSRSSWPSGEWYHPHCSLFTARGKGGLGLLNAYGSETCGKPRIY